MVEGGAGLMGGQYERAIFLLGYVMLCNLRLCLLIDQSFSFLLERCFIFSWMFWEENKTSLFFVLRQLPSFLPTLWIRLAVSQIRGVTTLVPHKRINMFCRKVLQAWQSLRLWELAAWRHSTLSLSSTHDHKHNVLLVTPPLSPPTIFFLLLMRCLRRRWFLIKGMIPGLEHCMEPCMTSFATLSLKTSLSRRSISHMDNGIWAF